jgi:hypothetical protein
MRTPLYYVAAILSLAMVFPRASAEQFTLFPERKELHSPDGRFVIRSVDHSAAANEFSGVFRTLVLEEVATGKVRKLYDYVGRVAVAWSDNDFIIVTDYVNKKTSRAMVFPADPARDVLALDKVQMSSLIPDEQSVHLQQRGSVERGGNSAEPEGVGLRAA